MRVKKMPIDLLNPDCAFIDGAIEEHNEIYRKLSGLKEEKTKIEADIIETREKLRNSKADSLIDADRWVSSYRVNKYLVYIFLGIGALPPILTSAYKFLKGELPESHDIESIASYFYAGSSGSHSLTADINGIISAYFGLWATIQYIEKRKDAKVFEQLTGYELTEETSKAAKDCAKYVRERIQKP